MYNVFDIRLIPCMSIDSYKRKSKKKEKRLKPNLWHNDSNII